MIICKAVKCRWNTRQQGIDAPTTCACPAVIVKFVDSDVPVCTTYKEVQDDDTRRSN